MISDTFILIILWVIFAAILFIGQGFDPVSALP